VVTDLPRLGGVATSPQPTFYSYSTVGSNFFIEEKEKRKEKGGVTFWYVGNGDLSFQWTF
jgi:hypothetical protein